MQLCCLHQQVRASITPLHDAARQNISHWTIVTIAESPIDLIRSSEATTQLQPIIVAYVLLSGEFYLVRLLQLRNDYGYDYNYDYDYDYELFCS